MSDPTCRHPLLPGCARLAPATGDQALPAPGVAVWVWHGPPEHGCDPDRFVVAVEWASQRWLQSADVVIGSGGATLADAMRVVERLDRLPGWAVLAVPAGQRRWLYRTRVEQVVMAGRAVCPTCLYPWLVTGGRLTDLTDVS